MSSPDINYPTQPTYGEGLAEALKAQAEFLQGTGDFADVGSLESLLPLEESVRKKTAQTDTDVLRQTLLGTEREMKVTQDPDTGKFGIQGAEVVTNEEGEPQTTGGGRYQIMQIDSGSEPVQRTARAGATPGVTPKYQILDTQTGGITATVGGQAYGVTTSAVDSELRGLDVQEATALELEEITKQFRSLENTIEEAGGDPDAAEEAVAAEFTFTNPNIPTDASKAGQPGYDDKGNRLLTGGQNVAEQTITVREGDGMVDLLGDTRQLQGQVSDFNAYVDNNPDLAEAAQAAVASGQFATKEEFGRDHYERLGQTEGRALPTKLGDLDRQAGFSETGEFLGASALAEDIAAGSTSRQRERDIFDVERLSGRFKNIMEDFRPAAATGIEGAKTLLEQQQERIATGGDVISDPTKIGEDGSYALTGEAGLGEDTLRNMLLQEAKAGLQSGLTEREQARIRDAFKGQSTMMGRTFDQSAGIAEAQAQVEEDNRRRLQNLGIAQSALGQESGLQAGDIARAMTSDQFNVATQMDAETKNEQLRQQGLANYIGAVGNLAAIEDQYTLDPFAAILGRGSKDTLAAGQGVLGSANYGLQSAPQYLNPEAGLGYISQMAANNANIAAAQGASQSSLLDGLLGAGGSIIGGMATGGTGLFRP